MYATLPSISTHSSIGSGEHDAANNNAVAIVNM